MRFPFLHPPRNSNILALISHHESAISHYAQQSRHSFLHSGPHPIFSGYPVDTIGPRRFSHSPNELKARLLPFCGITMPAFLSNTRGLRIAASPTLNRPSPDIVPNWIRLDRVGLGRIGSDWIGSHCGVSDWGREDLFWMRRPPYGQTTVTHEKTAHGNFSLRLNQVDGQIETPRLPGSSMAAAAAAAEISERAAMVGGWATWARCRVDSHDTIGMVQI